jgi:hypothetical protein
VRPGGERGSAEARVVCVPLRLCIGVRWLAQTLFFNVCDLPKAPFAEGCNEMPRPPPWSIREIADSKLRSLRQPPLNNSPRRIS